MENYNYETIRKLVGAAFDDEGLLIFCTDCFSDVAEQFTAGQTKGARVHLLIEYVKRHGLTDRLLKGIMKSNSYQYKLFENDLKKDAPDAQSATQKKPSFTGGNEAEIPDKATLTFELDRFLFIIKELMPLFHWLQISVPSKQAQKYFSALQEFFNGNFFDLNGNLQFGTDNLLRVIRTGSINDGYGHGKMERAFECFMSYLSGIDNTTEREHFESSGFNMRELVLIAEHRFEFALDSNMIVPKEIPLVRFIVALLQYAEKYIQAGSPKKYPEVPELITREFQFLLEKLFDINLRVIFPDSLSIDYYSEIRELCKNEWETFCKNYEKYQRILKYLFIIVIAALILVSVIIIQVVQ